jgi:hypothetical protein
MQAPSLAPYAALPSTLANDEEKKNSYSYSSPNGRDDNHIELISKWQESMKPLPKPTTGRLDSDLCPESYQ